MACFASQQLLHVSSMGFGEPTLQNGSLNSVVSVHGLRISDSDILRVSNGVCGALVCAQIGSVVSK